MKNPFFNLPTLDYTVHIFINISVFYWSVIYHQAAIAAIERIGKCKRRSSRHNHVLIDVYYKARYN